MTGEQMMRDAYGQMAADLADGTPKILAALDKLIANGMPFATAASTSAAPSTRCAVCGTERGLNLGRGDGKWRCQNAECT